ncbi:hypothetical protein ELE00_24195, partial [Klebsiella pneumoniae]|nr:hypothetical protein [Klebsiella pneumoniae]
MTKSGQVPGEKRLRLTPGNDQIDESFLRYREFQFMSKMKHDQPSAAVPASRDRRNFLIAGAGLA